METNTVAEKILSNPRVSDERLRELIRAYADCGCGLGPNAACADTVKLLNELEATRIETKRLTELSVDLREDYLHLMRRIGDARDLLSGEFYNEALGELDDALNGTSFSASE